MKQIWIRFLDSSLFNTLKCHSLSSLRVLTFKSQSVREKVALISYSELILWRGSWPLVTCDRLTSPGATDGQLRQVRRLSPGFSSRITMRSYPRYSDPGTGHGSTWVAIIVTRHRRGKQRRETERDSGCDNDMTHLAQDTARRPLYTINIINPFPFPKRPDDELFFHVFGDWLLHFLVMCHAHDCYHYHLSMKLEDSESKDVVFDPLLPLKIC